METLNTTATQNENMVLDGDYHHSLGLPEGIEYPRCFVELQHTYHAKQEADSQKYREFTLPKGVLFDGLSAVAYYPDGRERGGELTEITVEDGEVVKVSPRVSLHDYDMTLVIALDSEPATLITAWLNPKDDYPTPTGRNYIKPETVALKHKS